MLIVRKEWFGGIIADSQSYDARIINDVAFYSLQNSIATTGKITDQQKALFNNVGFNCDTNAVRLIDLSPKIKTPQLSAPIILWLELTSKCPLKCKHCFIDCKNLPEDKHLPYQIVERILEEAAAMGVVRVTLSGGEAFSYPHIRESIQKVNELGMGLRVFTNGIVNKKTMEWLRKEKIDTMFVSLDGGESHHNELRGKNTFRMARDTLIKISQFEGIKNITLSISLDKKNICDMGEIIDLCKESNIKTLLIRPLMGYSWTSEVNEYVFYDKRELLSALNELESLANIHDIECQLNKIPHFPINKKLYIEDNEHNASYWNLAGIDNSIDCVGGNLVCGIRYDGAVSPCGFIGLKHSDSDDNSIFSHSLPHLWNNSSNLKRMRNIKSNQSCSNCKMLQVCNGGCRANSFNLTSDLSGVDPYCMYNQTEYGDRILDSGKLQTSTSHSMGVNDFYVSVKRLVSKCGWATYE